MLYQKHFPMLWGDFPAFHKLIQGQVCDYAETIQPTNQILKMDWQVFNQNDNTNNESALAKWSKTKRCWSWSMKTGSKQQRAVIIKQTIKTSDEPPEGSRQTKVSLGCAISMSIHSGPMGKDLHLAVKLRRHFYWRGNFVIVRTRID